MTLPVPDDGWVIIDGGKRLFSELILFENRKQILVAAISDWPELVIVPLLVKNILDVAISVASAGLPDLLSTLLADKGPEPQDNVGGLGSFAADAVVVEGLGQSEVQV